MLVYKSYQLSFRLISKQTNTVLSHIDSQLNINFSMDIELDSSGFQYARKLSNVGEGKKMRRYVSFYSLMIMCNFDFKQLLYNFRYHEASA